MTYRYRGRDMAIYEKKKRMCLDRKEETGRPGRGQKKRRRPIEATLKTDIISDNYSILWSTRSCVCIDRWRL